MKARILALLALVLGVVSCQTEPEGLDVNVGGEVETTVCVSLPEATRANSAVGAVGTFNNVDWNTYTVRYIMQIFDQNGRASEAEYVAYKDGNEDNNSVTFPVRLVPNRDYNFVVWADIVTDAGKTDLHYNLHNGDEGALDLTNITLNDTWVAMDETRDAYTGFYNTEVEGTKYSSSLPINITLTRPFAKLRVITTDMVELDNLGIKPHNAVVTYTTKFHESFNACNGEYGDETVEKTHTFNYADVTSYTDQTGANKVLFTDYFFADDSDVVKFVMNVNENGGALIKSNNFSTDIAVQRNYLTTIQGNILTDGNNVTVKVEDAFAGNVDYDSDKDEQTTTVNTAADFAEAFSNENIDVIVLNGNINLDELVTRSAADKVWTIAKDKELTLDLNGYTLSATSVEKGKNFYMFNSYGTLNVKNGTILYQHNGDNMEWNNCTSIFYAGANGTLNLDGVIAKNLGGSDMAYVVDMTNAQNINVNIENSTLESTYIAVRVFNNSKTGVNNVDIKNTTLSGKYCFWVQYWLADGRDEATLEQTLNINIYNQGNTFEYTGASAVIYGFNETVYANKDGITKKVSEDGTEVTLGSVIENGVVDRGVAGAEENTTIKKVVVEEGVGVLYNRTFRRFYALEEVALPNTLTEIGPAVFQSCSKLANITIPESVTTIGEGAFAECTALTSINIPAGITRLEKDVLRNTGLTSVEIPASVNYIGTYAFRDCESLTEIKILSPEFTIESNTFTNMAAPVPTMTIHVVNAEMKAYLESVLTNYDKTYITVVGPEAVNTTAGLQAALANDNKIVTVAAGNYTFPSSSVKAGQTIICEEGTVFTGTSSLNINGATVIGAEFKNENGIAVRDTIYGNFKNCTFTGSEALRWCYSEAGKTTVFENCVIKTDFRGFHYDGMNGDVIFRNCEINGFNAYGGEGTATFEGCTFGCDESRYNGLNIYANTNLVNCTFNFVSGKTNFVDLEAVGKTLTITNCTANLDGVAVNIADYVGGSKEGDCTVIIK